MKQTIWEFPSSECARGKNERHPSGAKFGTYDERLATFSAVSASIFASRKAFVSIFQNLPDYLAEIFENWQIFANFATFAIFLLHFHENR